MSYNLDTDLFPAATGLVGDQGLSSLSLRAVASRMGVSASSLVYRFQSREGLLCWLLERLVSADAAAWQRRREEILHLSLTRAEIQAIARAVMTEQVLVHKAVCTGLWEFELASHSNAKFREYISLWRHNDIGFWERCFAQVGLDEKLAPSWASGLLALFRLLLISDPTTISLAWIEDAVERLFERLTDQPPSRPGDSFWRAKSEAAVIMTGEVSYSEESTAFRIIAAASEIILEKGCDGLSHRSIAAKAKVSLSSMTHHFGTLDDIFFGAFWKIYSDARAEAQSLPTKRMSYTRHELTYEIIPKLNGINGRGQASTVAMESIILRASRQKDCRDMSIALFALMGTTSVTLLQGISDTDKTFDRLDGHIFRLVLAGMRSLHADAPSPGLNPGERLFLNALL